MANRKYEALMSGKTKTSVEKIENPATFSPESVNRQPALSTKNFTQGRLDKTFLLLTCVNILGFSKLSLPPDLVSNSAEGNSTEGMDSDSSTAASEISDACSCYVEGNA
ncbi:hypothetical protein ACTXT7_008586 [Hymenolepis weldensis]